MIQSLDELKSTRMTYRAGDLFNPPGLTNFLGTLQSYTCVTGLQHLTFPPLSQGDTVIGALTVNDRCVSASGLPITFVWRPDRIVRSVDLAPLAIKSTTAMLVDCNAVTIKVDVTNTAGENQPVCMKFRTAGGAIQSADGWHTPYSPKEGATISVTPWEGAPPPETLVENACRVLESGDGIEYASTSSSAFSIQGVTPMPSSIERSWINCAFELAPGERKTVFFFVGLSEVQDKVARLFEQWKLNPQGALDLAETDWLTEMQAVFLPGNDRYSGSLPTLRTSNRDLRTIYLTSILGVVYHKRFTTRNHSGRTYVTLMPRYWVTTSFINDWSMSSYLLAMLDPDCLKHQVELWLSRDIYSHFGTEYVSGGNAGNWYSCNDFAMLRLITTYVRITGNRDWLSSNVGGTTILEHCRLLALHWQKLDRGSGLADYGDRNSLLEAVSSYTNEVTSLNAANVWNCRELASLEIALGGVEEDAADLKRQAADLVRKVQLLYVEGEGYWNIRKRDGSLVPVRHVWDLVHSLNYLAEDLPAPQVDEMIKFFEKELRSSTWMAALSPLDEDVTFSQRPDHQWNGSWPGWVALAACALVTHNRIEVLADWIPGLARTANQGPYSQAHFVETHSRSVDGGARKAPTEWPHITDWATVCVGGFFELIVLSLFGLDFDYDTLSVRTRLDGIDESASLENVLYQGDLFNVSSSGELKRSSV